MTADTPVGIVGLGLMGVALSARLIDAKIPLVGFDIDPVRCGMFKATGGMVATSVRELAACSANDHRRRLLRRTGRGAVR